MTYRRRYSQPRPARWLEVRYAGACHVCGTALAKGTRAFYDPAKRELTCPQLLCLKAADLVERVPSAIPDRMTYRTKRGRCEDAPCCGCCDDGTGRQW